MQELINQAGGSFAHLCLEAGDRLSRPQTPRRKTHPAENVEMPGKSHQSGPILRLISRPIDWPRSRPTRWRRDKPTGYRTARYQNIWRLTLCSGETARQALVKPAPYSHRRRRLHVIVSRERRAEVRKRTVATGSVGSAAFGQKKTFDARIRARLGVTDLSAAPRAQSCFHLDRAPSRISRSQKYPVRQPRCSPRCAAWREALPDRLRGS